MSNSFRYGWNAALAGAPVVACLDAGAQLGDQSRRDKAIEQDRMRIERDAKLRLEDGKRKLRELARENDRR